MNYGRNNTSRRRLKIQAKAAKRRRKPERSTYKTVLLVLLGIGILGLLGGGLLFKTIIDRAPKITDDSLKPSAYITTVYANDGTTELGTFVSSGSNRVYKKLEEIPKDLQEAFIAIEDSRFEDHNGIDLKGIMRAAVTGITSGNFSQGGSTITQQLIKNRAFPNFTNETTVQKVERKIQEWYLAIKTEKTLEKDEILEYYLNTINLGQNTLGVQAASMRYFNKDVSELTLSECAVIAAITQNPTAYNPIVNPDKNLPRREKVLDNMLKEKYITKEEHKAALDDTDIYNRIQIANTQFQENQTVHSYFMDEVAKSVMNDLCNDMGYTKDQAYEAVYSGGLKIITTQDVTMQQICEEELNRDANYPSNVEWTVTCAITITHVDGTQENFDHYTFGEYVKKTYDVEYGTTFASQEKANAMIEDYISTLKTDPNDRVDTNITLSPQPQATIVVMDQYTGHVKAIVGGRGEKTGNMTLNRATQSPRQPGSCFKILTTYVPALDTKGDSLATTILDSAYKYKSNGEYVKNWWGGYKGNLTIRYCIEQSANVCTVKKYAEVTPAVGLDYLVNKFHFTTIDQVNDSGESACLGGITNGVYNIEMTAAYAAIANKGVYTEPILYTHLYDHDGNLLYENTPSTNEAMKASTAALITSAMKDVVTKGTGTMTRLSGMTSAGKTGTTTDDCDFWFSGYTPYLTASVWGGYDDHQSMSGSSSFHKVIWRKVMQRIHDTYDYKSVAFEMPEGVVRKTICTKTGLIATSDTCSKYTEYFASDALPKGSCPGHAAETPASPAEGTPATPAPGTTQ